MARKSHSKVNPEPAQPMLRGINLARFLAVVDRDGERVWRLETAGGSCSDLPPLPETATSCVGEKLADHKMLVLPRRL